jgi:hypothetical protein
MRRQKRTPRPRRSKLKEILISFLLVLLVLGLAARPLAKGALFYQNYWGGPVFVPFVVLIAAIIVVGAVIRLMRK